MKHLLITLLALTCFSACGSPDDNNNFLAPENTSVSNDSQLAGSLGTVENESSASSSTPVPTFTPVPTPAPAAVSSLRISSFIWKPESERDGKLVVLVNPTNVRILISGSISETLSNSGPSNGKGTTGRGSFSGCSYGNDITVEFFDSRGVRILTRGGRRGLMIPRGCDRFEF